jgi:poly-beta-1,6-N-acetyl-D-glucosamine synthase
MLLFYWYCIIVSTLVLLIFYYIFLQLLKIDVAEKSKGKIIPISLIICAKNELEHLKTHLPIWMNQNHPQFEVVLVNDASDDGSSEWLDSIANQYTNLRLVHVATTEPKILKGKRHALLKGIENAKNECLILTDADCYPASKNWLMQMSRGFEQGKEVVIGYSPYEQKSGWLNLFIQYDTFLTALQYLSLAKLGFPYMGVGRNVGYLKSLVDEKVFQKSNATQSGDDDLLISEIAHANNVFIELHPDATVMSKPEMNFSGWVRQKTRHYTAGYHYKTTTKILLGSFLVANILFIIGLLGLLIVGQIIPAFVLLIAKGLIFSIISNKLQSELKFKGIDKRFIFIDVLYWFLFLFFQIKHIFNAENVWHTKKNRR